MAELSPRRIALNAQTRLSAERDGLTTVVTGGGRVIATRPEAVFVLLFRPDEQILLLRKPGSHWWQPVGGAVDAGESPLEAAMRELYEELGPLVQASPIGLVHAWNFRYDDNVRWMTDLAWVASYEGGELVPGDDVVGSELGWFAVDSVVNLGIVVPGGSGWLLRRAVALFRTYRDDPTPGDWAVPRELFPSTLPGSS